MRRALFAAVAAAPLCALFGVAQAETVISTGRTTPVNTATANNGAADDVRIASGGSVTVTSGTAVTLDSNNTVANDGTIAANNAAGGTGILVQGGRTGSVVNRGTINVLEDFSPTDSDNDGDLDGPFAQGAARYGVRVTGASPFTGSITQEAAGRISVEGVDSFGVSVEPGLTGNLILRGGIAMLGDRTRAVSVTGSVGGNVNLGGLTSQGLGAIGADIAGPVAGRLTIDGSVATTGYRSTTRPADPSRLDADDLLQGGPAVRIAASVAGGVVVDAIPADRSTTDTDEDDDGLADNLQGAGVVESFGSAPGLLLSGSGQDIDIGPLVAGQAGLQVKGRVSAAGLFDGINATAVQVGAGTGAVRIANGVRVTGTVEAAAAQGTATGVLLGAGGAAPLLDLAGIVRGTATGGAGTARAVRIEAGATAPTLRNSGLMEAAVSGGTADAVVVDDRSGTLGLVENSGRVRVTRTVDAGTAVTGRNVAFDLTANSTGATVRQFGVADGDDGADNAADPDADGDGVDDADEPFIIGDAQFGAGADRLELLNGVMIGGVAFGAGADVLLIDGGARLAGAVTDSDGLLTVDIRRGVLELSNTQPVQMSGLAVGADSQLIITLNPASTVPAVNVSGTAAFASGAELGLRLTSLVQAPQRFTLLQAGVLQATGLDTDVSGETPYLFVASVGVDAASRSIFADVRRRTAAEIGFNRAEAGAYDGVYAAIGQDAALRSAFLGQTTREGFIDLYEQMLPEHAGGAVYSLATGAEAMSRALRGRRGGATAGGDGGWLQEVGFIVRRDRDADSGFDAGGFGVMGGLETRAFGGSAGISAALLTTDVDDPSSALNESTNVSVLEGGLYWTGDFGGLTLTTRGAVGWAKLESDRRFSGAGLERAAAAEWNGLTATAHAGAAYEAGFGRFYARPEVSVDGFFLREDAYQESGGGAGFDLAVEDRNSRLITGTGLVTLGARFGRDFWVAPEVSGGWRQTLSGEIGETVARFGSAGTPFTVLAADAPEGAAVLGLAITGGSQYSLISLRARIESGDAYEAADLTLTAKFRF